MEPLTGSTLNRCEMMEELTSRNLNRDDLETVISFTDRAKGDAYIETLPLCLSARSPYIYEVSSEKDNFTLCCGKEKAHVLTCCVSSEGCWPQYTPGEGVKLK